MSCGCARARNYFCGTRETAAAWWRSAWLLLRRVRRDCKKKKKKREGRMARRVGGCRRARSTARSGGPSAWLPAAYGAAPPGLQGVGTCAAPRTGCAACRAPSLGWRPPPRGAPRRAKHCPISYSTAAVPCYAASKVEITYLGQGRRIAAVNLPGAAGLFSDCLTGMPPGVGGLGRRLLCDGLLWAPGLGQTSAAATGDPAPGENAVKLHLWAAASYVSA